LNEFKNTTILVKLSPQKSVACLVYFSLALSYIGVSSSLLTVLILLGHSEVIL